MIDNYKQGMDDLPKVKKFQCRVNNQYEEIVAYNDTIDFIESNKTVGVMATTLRVFSNRQL